MAAVPVMVTGRPTLPRLYPGAVRLAMQAAVMVSRLLGCVEGDEANASRLALMITSAHAGPLRNE